jgi:predicted nucleotidyltransferase/DNA-binding Xre family transcriptional regulator
MEDATHLGARIKARRRELGISAAQLALAVGVTENALRKLESGDSAEPRFSTGIRLARALGISPLVLVPVDSTNAAPPSLPRVINAIREQRAQLEAEGIEHIDVFGSVVRGNAHEGSDVDIIVTPRQDVSFSGFELGGAIIVLEAALGCEADVVTRRAAERSPRLKRAIQECVRVF